MRKSFMIAVREQPQIVIELLWEKYDWRKILCDGIFIEGVIFFVQYEHLDLKEYFFKILTF